MSLSVTIDLVTTAQLFRLPPNQPTNPLLPNLPPSSQKEMSLRNTRKSDSAVELAKDDKTDPRHPIYLGDWKRAFPDTHDDIAKDDMDEPHIKRKRAILAVHPEIKSLYGYEPLTKWVTLGLVSIQLSLAYVFGNELFWKNDQLESNNRLLTYWLPFMATVYFIGAPITQNFGIIIHEASHALCFQSLFLNRVLGLVANICIPFPIAQSFRRYHLEHHAFQGVIGRDPDLPLDWEIKWVKGNPLMKFMFLFFYPMMYVLRGAAQQKTPSTWELINWVFTMTTDAVIFSVCGPKGLLYLFLSLWFGYGIHVSAAHFIQEHFTFDDGQETYSYYGSLNKVFMNIGYHNEHHDFTHVAWTNLPKVTEMAPEFYDPLSNHMSWFKVLYDFVMNKDIGPVSRVGRDIEDHKRARRMVAQLNL